MSEIDLLPRADLQIEREKTAKLEAELAQERAAKQAEADAARKLALAPDVEKLGQFATFLRSIEGPKMTTQGADALVVGILTELKSMACEIETSCINWGLTGK